MHALVINKLGKPLVFVLPSLIFLDDIENLLLIHAYKLSMTDVTRLKPNEVSLFAFYIK